MNPNYKETRITLQYKVPSLSLIGEKETKFCVGPNLQKDVEKLLKQPFVSRVLFPQQQQEQQLRPDNLQIISENIISVEFQPFLEEQNGLQRLNMSFMIPGKVSKTSTGLKPLVLIGLERSEIWRIIESELFKEYIYSTTEMAPKLPPDASGRYCVKLKELSLEYGELLFSVQLA